MAVARLRTVGAARGITEVTVARGPGFGAPDLLARCAPVLLPLSRQARLVRLYKGAKYKESQHQLLLPLSSTKPASSAGEDMASALIAMIEDLVPLAVAPA